mmetsp:Transcript_46858/g.111156  ORF Transcript_46858/g.111156 Transcript_46858/m.111156 type:complete len:483 (+) Transcript_46858:3837-5285(+)
MGIHLLQLGVGIGKIVLSLLQRISLRLDGHDDVVVDDDVLEEIAKTSRGVGLLLHDLKVRNVFKREVRARSVHVLGGQRTIVDDRLHPLQVLDELVHVLHHVLGRVPVPVLRAFSAQCQHRCRDVVDTRRRLRKRLELAQILLVERVQRSLGLLDSGDSCCKIPLAILLHRPGSRSDLRRLLSLDVRRLRCSLDLGFLSSDFLGHLVGFLLGHLDLSRLDLHLLHQHCDVLGSALELVQTVAEAVDVVLKLLAVVGKHVLVQVDQLEEGLGSGVVVSLLRCEVLAGRLVHAPERERHELGDCSLGLVGAEFDVAQELLGHVKQGRLRPRLEPIDDAAVDERREARGPAAESLTHRREAQADMEVLLDLGDEEVIHRILRIGDPFALALVSDGVVDCVDLVGGEQAGDLAGGKQLVQVHEELLVGNLRVHEEEDNRLVLEAGLEVHLLDVLLEIAHAVRSRDGDLRHRRVADKRRQPAQRLLA